MRILTQLLFCVSLLLFVGCKKEADTVQNASSVTNAVTTATGFSLYHYDGYTLLTIKNPWPNAAKQFRYVLRKADAKIPDSLKALPVIPIPLQSIVVTSTTHIPSLEMLGVEETLTGFPNLDYISSEKVRQRITDGKVRELGSNQSLNMEQVLDLQPQLVVAFGIDNNNPMYDQLQRNGLKVVFNGDWNEPTPLGKAEWIKFFGALYDKDEKAAELYTKIADDYKKTKELAARQTTHPTVMAGAIYENHWYLPHGNSWSSLFLADAGAHYLWKDSQGTGSLSLPFEAVLEKAKDAQFWIGPAEFTSLAEMKAANPHYQQFKAFQDGKVYSFSVKKGAKGGLVFYELAPNRPDLVLKDLVKILHPELLPGYEPFFFVQLQ